MSPSKFKSIDFYPNYWIAIQPEYSFSGELDIVAAHPEGGLCVLTEKYPPKHLQNLQVSESQIEFGIIKIMALSANSTFLALFEDDYKVKVIKADFTLAFSESYTNKKKMPKQMVWCGADAVCLVYKNFIGIIGPEN